MSLPQLLAGTRIRAAVSSAVGGLSFGGLTGFLTGRSGGDGVLSGLNRAMWAIMALVAVIAVGQVLDVNTEV